MLVSASPPNRGTLTYDPATNQLTYTPDAGFKGTDTFTYRISDGFASSVPATVTITVTAVTDPGDNIAPVAGDDTFGTEQGTELTITTVDLLANDTDADGDPLSVIPGLVDLPAHGILDNGNGGVIYTPDPGFVGTDTFTYRATDGTTTSNLATVTITVTAVTDPGDNIAPVAGDDTFSTEQGTELTITTVDLLANDTDADGDPLSVIPGLVDLPAHGILDNGNGGVIYTPDPGFVGTDTFTYRATDGTTTSNLATVTITVTANDPADNTAPQATWGLGSVNETTGRVTGKVFGTDADGDPLTYTVTLNPGSGSVNLSATGDFTYSPTQAARDAALQTPGPDFDTFTVTVSDGQASTTTTVEVPIAATPVNYPPRTDGPPTFVTNAANGTVVGSLNVLDPNADPLSFTVTGQPAHGSLAVDATGGFVYTPSAATRQQASQTPGRDTDSFTVLVSDGVAAINVSVTVPVAPADLTSTPIALGGYPAGAVASPDGSRLYVVNMGNNTVSVIDTTSNTVAENIDIAATPHNIAISRDGRYVYVSNHANGAVVASTVSVIDTNTNTVTTTITIPDPDGHNYGSYLAVSPDGSQLFVANRADQSISVVDATTNTVISTRNVGYCGDGEMVFAPDGRLYVNESSAVVVLDPVSMTVLDTVDVWPDGISGFAPSPDGSRVYVTRVNIDDGGSYSSLAVIDAATNTEIARIYDPRGDFQPYEVVWSGVAVSPDGSRVYVPMSDGKTITVIDTATNAIVDAFITELDEPGELGYTQYLTVGSDGTLYISDGNKGTVYAVTVGDDPVDL